jgi:hypothetical protein
MSRSRGAATAESHGSRSGDSVLLSGKLDQTDLFEICQFLLLGQKTGVLEVEARGKKGALYFDHGQIVNALDDALGDGEQAAYRIFAWSGGSFVFKLQPPPPLRSIQTGTESLILDIARVMDERREESAQRGEPEDEKEKWSHEEGIKKRAETGDELRQLFQSLRGERAGGLSDDPLARLWEQAQSSGLSAVLLRPGDAALGLRDGRMTPMPGLVASDTVTMAIAALGASGTFGVAQRREAPSGPFLVSLLQEAGGEALFLKGVPPAMDWSASGLPEEWLEEAVGSARGLVWLGAPPASGRSVTARALAEEFAVRGRFTVLLGESLTEAASGPLSIRSTTADKLDHDLRQALHEGASCVLIDLVRGARASTLAHAAARSLVVACEPTPDFRTLLGRAAQNARARAMFLGAMFVTVSGATGHYESTWLSEETRLGLDLTKHPDRIQGLMEDPEAMSDAGPLSAAA